jgi:rhomboid-like protein
VAMYLTAGTVSSLGSHLHKLAIRNATPSLGASGAIMGILGLVCTRMPDIQLGIIFLPGVQFTADTVN